MRFSYSVLGLALLGACTTSASALTTFFGEDLGLGENTRLTSTPNANAARANFLSNLTGVGTETFESYTAGASLPISSTFTGAITATISGTGEVANVPTGTNSLGRYPISGNQYLESGQNFKIVFNTAVAAFGFYGIDIGDFDGQVTLTLLSGGTSTINIGNSIDVNGGGVLYFGIINTANPFTEITFGNTNSGIDFFGFDDMTVGTVAQVTEPVPEPMTLGLGLAGFAAALRRRRARRR